MFTAGFYDLAATRGCVAGARGFGQTLGHWARSRPFLVIPVLGPSNLRDAPGPATAVALCGRLPRQS